MSGGGTVSAGRRRLRRVALAEALAAFRRLPVDPSVVLYESFAGNGMVCNPEAVYRQLRSERRFDHLHHVWVLDDPAKHPSVVDELAGDPRVSVVTRRSTAYFRRLATAGYLVNNATFPAEFAKRPGQVYVNTWHGTPLKRMGYDIVGGGPDARNVVRNFLQADFLVSASPHMTEQLYATAYKMRNIFRGLVIEEGYPRVDRQAIGAEQARAALAASGLRIRPGPVVLYAPTWRGSSFQDPRDDSDVLVERVRRLSARLGDEWTVLVKAHQSVFDAARSHGGLAGALVDTDIPANVVLAAADALVADYSSIIVDYVALDRPIVLFRPDLGEYDDLRGLNDLGLDWPGPVHTEVDAVAAALRAIGTGEPGDPDLAHRQARHEWRERLCPHEDGQATQRLVEVVFSRRPEGHRLVDLSSDGRHRILLYVGALEPNGMTTSALNLLGALDHSRHDMTVVYTHREGSRQAATVAAIDPHVRTLGRFGTINGSKATQAARHVLQRQGVPSWYQAPPLPGLFRAEWERCFGQAAFDSVVDFVGYGAFMDLLFLHSGAPRNAIWMHNDMVADSRREVAGRQPLRRRLEAVFSTYRFFDNLVSVSPALRDVNRARLAEYAPASRFGYAQNVVAADSVRARARADLPVQLPAGPEGTTTFVASGRLSSAKNFPRLVSALAQVRQEYPGARVIILGDGPDRGDLEAHVDRLGVGDAVLLAGHQDNPFPIMAASDCFIMTSDHEGQPMVILEALVLGLPVVTTRFDSVESALPPGQGMIVPRSVEGVADGMRAFLRGQVPVVPFDAEEYNRRAVSQFLTAIGLSDPEGGDAVRGTLAWGPAGD